MNDQVSIFDTSGPEADHGQPASGSGPELDPARPAPGAWHRNGTDTERAAALAAMPRKGSQRARVLRAFEVDRADPTEPIGFTDYELGRLLSMFRWVAGTRRGELIRDGWPIVDTGERRPTDTGSTAIVWALRRPSNEGRGR